MSRAPSGQIHPEAPINVLLIGGGGRENALARKLVQSPRLRELYVANPENPGLAELGRPVDVPVSIREMYRLEQFCARERIGLCVIGPEDPLAEGFADKLRAAGVLVFGPGKDGARLEADKAWSKELMRSASIPTAEARSFSDPHQALAFVESRTEVPVIKASGLAKGKGVFVPETTADALAAVKTIMVDRAFGEAGSTVVVEEKLTGPEVSLLAIVDGRNILILPPCQDHKRLCDGDTGPNTGGMGAICPSLAIDEVMQARIEREILVPTVDALKREGIEYTGVLYAGLMLTHGGPKVLEFNCRFGDPETQPLMARFRGDLVEVMLAACQGRLDRVEVDWDAATACCVVLASAGYPEKPRQGAVITGVEEASALPGVFIDHAGAKRDAQGKLVVSGGRVLGVTGLGPTMEAARAKAYAACDLIKFEGKTYRKDIGVAAGRPKLRRV